ncbi:ABC transporter permease [Sanguibacter antarcticus]|uniref:Peptide/nickel transport system permease protein n=1 Tax=Sanguibacter antarcticus TaxID=372484 RepID=A0A2A9E6A2_9MICO|nr:ABC transporter permease [Sanguibacter antarcticus]PFG33762.1 peptide/nickel transport system permease protein [Sanguibacter antarcticus]
MLRFTLRRVGISLLVMLGASALLFWLVTLSGDPLADLRESNAENRATLMNARIETMDLDVPWWTRYGSWLLGVGRCFALSCDLGTTRNGVDVVQLMGNAAVTTLRLVVLSTLLAIVVGVAVGILTAIRQYSGFDYAVTLLAFLFFSLPVFWAAVLLKEYGAIRFNNWIADPDISPLTIVLVGLGGGLLLQAIVGGTLRRRLLTGGGGALYVVTTLAVFSANGWFREPPAGVVPATGLLLVGGVACAVLMTALVSGLANKRVLAASLTTAVVGVVATLVLRDVIDDPSHPIVLLGLGALWAGVALVIGRLMGGYSRKQAMLVSFVTATVFAVLVGASKVVEYWGSYLALQARPISTIGASTPGFVGTFWEDAIDKGTQLLLPTILLTLISVASYSRYTRSSMLDVLEQDYVRTARSKGLSERTVITRHAFRNALIPITTIVAFDFAGLIGGAVITEQVFGWKGMGELFKTGLTQVDPVPVMAFFLVTGSAAILMNLLADIAYGFLDPRIRR